LDRSLFPQPFIVTRLAQVNPQVAHPCPLPDYEPGDGFDEAYSAPGVLRAHYVRTIEELAGRDLAELADAIARDVTDCGMSFTTKSGSQPFPIDPVPRIVERDDWRLIESGLGQRARALNAFLADVYGPQRIVAAGKLPERVIEGAELLERDLLGVEPAGGVHAGVAGFDVVRDATGELEVLEDNLRTPSGLAYIEAAREIVARRLSAPEDLAPPGTVDYLCETLAGAVPAGAEEPSIVLLSDGPSNSAFWEHRRLAREAGIALVTPREVELRGDRLWARDGDGGAFAVDVVYRRTDEDRLRDEGGSLTWVGELLLEPLRAGTVSCVNAFGTGLADDKLVHAYVEEMIRFYLGEEPVVRSVHTYDPGDPEVRAEVLERIGELVIKPRNGSGGGGVIVCPHASADDVDHAAKLIRTQPDAYVVQDTIHLSTHPTVVDGGLEPRHVDLRSFAFSTPERPRVLAGGLTRVALGRGALVVNSSMNGGGKDTWMLT
jgi:uncharacterized circularly permuted ATP-grasp superfamily protein